MRTIFYSILLFCIVASIYSNAWAMPCRFPVLNKVTLMLDAEEWVTTKTAKVRVVVDASLSGAKLAEVQDKIMHNLRQISDASEWRLVELSRTQDQSHLEQIHAVSEARLPSNQLADLRDKAKKISVPGETYQIDSIDTQPSEEEIDQAQAGLRQKIYENAKAELARLNEIYPDAHYVLHEINFVPPYFNQGGRMMGDGKLQEAAMSFMAQPGPMVGDSMAKTTSSSLSKKLSSNAYVVFAANFPKKCHDMDMMMQMKKEKAQHS